MRQSTPCLTLFFLRVKFGAASLLYLKSAQNQVVSHQLAQPLDRFDLFHRFVRAEIDDVEILPEQCPRHLFARGTGACEGTALTTAQARPPVARVLEDEQERKPDILSAIADH